MDLPEILREFDRLDKSSPKFPDQLANLLCGGGYRECIRNLRDGDVVWLVEYLDNVCISIAL